MNSKMLRSVMILNGDTNQTLADALGIHPVTMSAKLNGTNGAEFTQGEISAIRNRYRLEDHQFVDIFFDNTEERTK